MKSENLPLTLPATASSPLFAEEDENNLKSVLKTLGENLGLFSEFPKDAKLVSAEKIGKCLGKEAYALLEGIFLYIEHCENGGQN